MPPRHAEIAVRLRHGALAISAHLRCRRHSAAIHSNTEAKARTERHALSPSDRHRLARIVTIPRSHRVAYRGLACWSWPGWVLNGGPQPPGRVFVVQVEPHRGATQQAQLRQFRPHQLKGRLPACAGDGQVDVLLPQALPATGALAELVLAEQGIQHVFEVVARPKLLDRAPLARDRERHQQEHVVFWLAHRLHLPVIALLVGGGLAGLRAAISVAEEGLSVGLVSKVYPM